MLKNIPEIGGFCYEAELEDQPANGWICTETEHDRRSDCTGRRGSEISGEPAGKRDEPFRRQYDQGYCLMSGSGRFGQMIKQNNKTAYHAAADRRFYHLQKSSLVCTRGTGLVECLEILEG